MADESAQDQNAKTEAIQAVVDRVSSYQDGAPEGTVKTELLKGFDEAGVSVDDADVDKLAGAIESDNGSVDAATVLN
ncbi:hypothetical protein BH09ACT10_BH09ACT10_06610 [soil metagenome]